MLGLRPKPKTATDPSRAGGSFLFFMGFYVGFRNNVYLLILHETYQGKTGASLSDAPVMEDIINPYSISFSPLLGFFVSS